MPAAIYASDQDPAAVKIAQRTFQGAGVAVDIRLKQSDVLALEAPAEQGVLVINPPYGVRLSRPEELDAFYPQAGRLVETAIQRMAGLYLYRRFAGPQIDRPRSIETHSALQWSAGMSLV